MFAQKTDFKTLDRLKKRSDFLSAQHSGQKWVSKSFIIQIKQNEGSRLRYGLTVTKRVSKSAVIRNRIKRRLRTLACEVLPYIQSKNLDIVLIGRAGTLERSHEDLQQDLYWCLRKLDIPYKKRSAS